MFNHGVGFGHRLDCKYNLTVFAIHFSEDVHHRLNEAPGHDNQVACIFRLTAEDVLGSADGWALFGEAPLLHINNNVDPMLYCRS